MTVEEPTPVFIYVPPVYTGAREGVSGTVVTHHDHALQVTGVVAVAWFLAFLLWRWRRG